MSAKTNRASKTIVKAVSAETMNEALATYATADAKEQQMTAKMDAELTKIREKYADDLAALQKTKEDAYEVVQTYAMENMESLFTKKKSMELLHGVIGFRTGTPSLKLLPKVKWAMVLDNLKAYLPTYVRKIEEPAKDRLLADRDIPEVKEHLTKVGLTVSQDERFYIELKKEELPA